ncbi:pp-loop family protein [Cystoisospora suis]|uniref:tRNA(Ile)-lysidine synthetase n=1 Tax=Cystoisospora suis TaxID=483139 RepID=A0A2C6L6E8_9APIC|nr:pp-loop family protein [Cystoisospora suis]
MAAFAVWRTSPPERGRRLTAGSGVLLLALALSTTLSGCVHCPVVMNLAPNKAESHGQLKALKPPFFFSGLGRWSGCPNIRAQQQPGYGQDTSPRRFNPHLLSSSPECTGSCTGEIRGSLAEGSSRLYWCTASHLASAVAPSSFVLSCFFFPSCSHAPSCRGGHADYRRDPHTTCLAFALYTGPTGNFFRVARGSPPAPHWRSTSFLFVSCHCAWRTDSKFCPSCLERKSSMSSARSPFCRPPLLSSTAGLNLSTNRTRIPARPLSSCVSDHNPERGTIPGLWDDGDGFATTRDARLRTGRTRVLHSPYCSFGLPSCASSSANELRDPGSLETYCSSFRSPGRVLPRRLSRQSALPMKGHQGYRKDSVFSQNGTCNHDWSGEGHWQACTHSLPCPTATPQRWRRLCRSKFPWQVAWSHKASRKEHALKRPLPFGRRRLVLTGERLFRGASFPSRIDLCSTASGQRVRGRNTRTDRTESRGTSCVVGSSPHSPDILALTHFREAGLPSDVSAPLRLPPIENLDNEDSTGIPQREHSWVHSPNDEAGAGNKDISRGTCSQGKSTQRSQWRAGFSPLSQPLRLISEQFSCSQQRRPPAPGLFSVVSPLIYLGSSVRPCNSDPYCSHKESSPTPLGRSLCRSLPHPPETRGSHRQLPPETDFSQAIQKADAVPEEAALKRHFGNLPADSDIERDIRVPGPPFCPLPFSQSGCARSHSLCRHAADSQRRPCVHPEHGMGRGLSHRNFPGLTRHLGPAGRPAPVSPSVPFYGAAARVSPSFPLCADSTGGFRSGSSSCADPPVPYQQNMKNADDASCIPTGPRPGSLLCAPDRALRLRTCRGPAEQGEYPATERLALRMLTQPENPDLRPAVASDSGYQSATRHEADAADGTHCSARRERDCSEGLSWISPYSELFAPLFLSSPPASLSSPESLVRGVASNISIEKRARKSKEDLSKDESVTSSHTSSEYLPVTLSSPNHASEAHATEASAALAIDAVESTLLSSLRTLVRVLHPHLVNDFRRPARHCAPVSERSQGELECALLNAPEASATKHPKVALQQEQRPAGETDSEKFMDASSSEKGNLGTHGSDDLQAAHRFAEGRAKMMGHASLAESFPAAKRECSEGGRNGICSPCRVASSVLPSASLHCSSPGSPSSLSSLARQADNRKYSSGPSPLPLFLLCCSAGSDSVALVHAFARLFSPRTVPQVSQTTNSAGSAGTQRSRCLSAPVLSPARLDAKDQSPPSKRLLLDTGGDSTVEIPDYDSAVGARLPSSRRVVQRPTGQPQENAPGSRINAQNTGDDKAFEADAAGANNKCTHALKGDKMLSSLSQWRLRTGLPSFPVHVVYFNHGLRPSAAAEAEFVRVLCDAYGFPFHLCSITDKSTQATFATTCAVPRPPKSSKPPITSTGSSQESSDQATGPQTGSLPLNETVSPNLSAASFSPQHFLREWRRRESAKLLERLLLLAGSQRQGERIDSGSEKDLRQTQICYQSRSERDSPGNSNDASSSLAPIHLPLQAWCGSFPKEAAPYAPYISSSMRRHLHQAYLESLSKCGRLPEKDAHIEPSQQQAREPPSVGVSLSDLSSRAGPGSELRAAAHAPPCEAVPDTSTDSGLSSQDDLVYQSLQKGNVAQPISGTEDVKERETKEDTSIHKQPDEYKQQLKVLPPLAYVVMAHHAGDQLETLLMKLLRGAHISNLGGMSTVSSLDDNAHRLAVFRPFLLVRKAQLQRYVRALGGTWMEDESNASTEKYPRNAFRLSLIPLLASLVDRRLPENTHGETDVCRLDERAFDSHPSCVPCSPLGGGVRGSPDTQPTTSVDPAAEEITRQHVRAPLRMPLFLSELPGPRQSSRRAEGKGASPHVPHSSSRVRSSAKAALSASVQQVQPGCREQLYAPPGGDPQEKHGVGSSLPDSSALSQLSSLRATKGALAEATMAAAALSRLASSLSESDRTPNEVENLEQPRLGGMHQPAQRPYSGITPVPNEQEGEVKGKLGIPLSHSQEVHAGESSSSTKQLDLDRARTERQQLCDSLRQELKRFGLRKTHHNLNEDQHTPPAEEELLNFLQRVPVHKALLRLRPQNGTYATEDQNLLSAIAEVAAQIYGHSRSVEALVRRGAALARQSAALQEWIDVEATAWEERHIHDKELRPTFGTSASAPGAVDWKTSGHQRRQFSPGAPGSLPRDHLKGRETEADVKQETAESVPENACSDKQHVTGASTVRSHDFTRESPSERFPLEAWQNEVPSLFLQQQLLHRWLRRASGGTLTLSFSSLEALVSVLLSRKPSHLSKKQREETAEQLEQVRRRNNIQEGAWGTGRHSNETERPSWVPTTLLHRGRGDLWHVNLPGRFTVVEYQRYLYLMRDP